MKRCRLKIAACGSCKHPEFMTLKNASLCPTAFPSLVGIIEHPDEGVILFDTGYDHAFFEATRTFPERLYRWTAPLTLGDDQNALSQLKKMGYKAEDVRRIIISHFHGDHVSGLHNFPNAKIHCSSSGLKNAHQGSRFKRIRKGILLSLIPPNLEERSIFFETGPHVALPQDFKPFSEAVDILGDGSLFAVELPGHCPGHWGLALRTQKDRFAFFVGDAAWSTTAIEQNMPPPKITIKLLSSTEKYYETLSQLNELHCQTNNVLLLPSHCKAIAQSYDQGDI